MDTFEKRKAETLASIGSSEPDKSPKGSIDEPIIPLLNIINSHPSYFTTSSCSGRISILSHPSTTTTKKKAKGGKWVFITHHKADPDSLLSLLFLPTSEKTPTLEMTEPSDLVLRFEPLIIAIECKDVLSALKLVSLAISCGFRESGVTSVSNKRVIIAVRCSIRLEVPLGGGGEGIFVSPEYVRYLVAIANEKMEANWRRTDGFLSLLMKSGFGGDEVAESVGGEFVNGEAGDEEGCVKSEAVDSGNQLNLMSDGKVPDDNHVGSSGFANISLPVERMRISGEPAEKLFLWGHSACTIDNIDHKKILIFGGFGGIGRHARRNDSSLLDPLCGQLETISVQGAPSPRMGHTSSMVGDRMILIGGRADPVNILNDVWVFNLTTSEWKLLECSGSVLSPRHRHAAAAVDSKIYVFGGLGGNFISSALYVLDISSFEWNEVCVQGECPSPRHSHTLAAIGSMLYMFGGYDGVKALGDLYSFDTRKCLWRKEKMVGRSPHARFSHSMFVYGNYLGIIGGCPVRQHYEELVLLDLRLHLWKYVRLHSIGKDLFVRSTASVVGDDLVMIGGGAACYAFGTKFSEPIRINLLPLMSLSSVENGVEHTVYNDEGDVEQVNSKFKVQQSSNSQISNGGPILNFETEPPETDVCCHIIASVVEQGNSELKVKQNSKSQIPNGGPLLNFETELQGTDVNRRIIASHWILQLERKHAKLAKDLLKKFGWLDLGRKAYSVENGKNICFPITEKFCTLYIDKQNHPGVSPEEEAFTGDAMILKDCTYLMALDLLMAKHATIHADEIVKVRKVSSSPLKVMNESVAPLIMHRGLRTELLDQLPTRWDRLGDIAVLPVSSFKDPIWESFGDELWPIVAKSLGAQRLARQGRVAPTGTRDSRLEILVGDNGWVDHCENGILYSFDSTKFMFSWGNLSEKLRMARLDCRDEVIVDLFAGIGYFVLPFLVRANAKLVYACEWNPHAVEALRCNLHANSVAERSILLEGDNRVTAPEGVADRVCLGLLPTSEGSWATAVRALRSKGGMLHVHGTAKDSDEAVWTEHVLKSISGISRSEGYAWEISIEHVERVKWYAPHIRHLVVDVRCKQIQR